MRFSAGRPPVSRSARNRAVCLLADLPFRRGRGIRQRCAKFLWRNSQVANASAPAKVAETTRQELRRRIGEDLESQGEEKEEASVAAVEKLVAEGALRGFGQGLQVPKRDYTLEELRLNRIKPEELLAPVDESLNQVRTQMQAALAAGVAAWAWAHHWGPSELLGAAVAALLLVGMDQVANAGGGEALVLDSIARVLKPSYRRRVALHEAGHFLIAYLIGVLPKGYTLSSWNAYQKYRALNVQAGCLFCDSSFNKEVSAGRLSSRSLDRYTCIALAGVATEWLYYGHAEGGMGDVVQLDGMLRALQFTQAKADSQVRWAVLNVVALLREARPLHAKLADAMQEGLPVSECILVIEDHLASDDAATPLLAAGALPSPRAGL